MNLNAFLEKLKVSSSVNVDETYNAYASLIESHKLIADAYLDSFLCYVDQFSDDLKNYQSFSIYYLGISKNIKLKQFRHKSNGDIVKKDSGLLFQENQSKDKLYNNIIELEKKIEKFYSTVEMITTLLKFLNNVLRKRD
jgi:hypothetical protein